MEQEIFGSILEQRVEVHKTGWNVATSQRRDVGSMRIEVNKRQRHDVSTSRRLNFATPARFSLSIIKRKKGTRNRGIEERTNKGTKIKAAAT